MKSKILLGIAVMALAVIAAWNVNLSTNVKGLSDLVLANVEALAVELPEITISCDHSHCSLGYQCHKNTYDWHCYCKATGKMSDTCNQ